MKPQPGSGIYYYLGNTTSHLSHALPLYRRLGGTMVVASKGFKKQLAGMGIEATCLDNTHPRLDQQTDRLRVRLGRPAKSLRLGPELKNTFRFLENNASAVIFYELYEFSQSTRLSRPKKIFLTHGMMLKGYFTMHPKRLEIIKDYDYMAAMGPAVKHRLAREGVSPDKLVDLGLARNDEVIALKNKAGRPPAIFKELGIDAARPVIAYLPTFWGPSSIYNVGKQIVGNFPEDYTLVFRPHPSTPAKLLKNYRTLIKSKANVIYAPEGRYPDLGLLDIYRLSSAIIGDVSSIMYESVLLKKPLLFAYDVGEHRQEDSDYEAIKDVVKYCQKIDTANTDKLRGILELSLKRGVNKNLWQTTIRQAFYQPDGTATQATAAFIRRLAGTA